MARAPKQPIPDYIRNEVFARDNYTCRYCGDKNGPFSPDHVYPESRGGETSVKNLVTACRKCNAKKHAKIGMWPKPIGYFDDRKAEHEKIIRKATIPLKQDVGIILVNLIPSSFMFAAMLAIPEIAGHWVVVGAVILWFGSSVIVGSQWVWNFLVN